MSPVGTRGLTWALGNHTMLAATNHIDQSYQAYDGKRRWEFLYEDVYLVIIDTGIKKGNDCNLIGISTDDLRVKWALSGVVESDDSYDGVVRVWVRGGQVWVGTWSGFQRRIDYRTGEVLEQVCVK